MSASRCRGSFCVIAKSWSALRIVREFSRSMRKQRSRVKLSGPLWVRVGLRFRVRSWIESAPVPWSSGKRTAEEYAESTRQKRKRDYISYYSAELYLLCFRLTLPPPAFDLRAKKEGCRFFFANAVHIYSTYLAYTLRPTNIIKYMHTYPQHHICTLTEFHSCQILFPSLKTVKIQ